MQCSVVECSVVECGEGVVVVMMYLLPWWGNNSCLFGKGLLYP